MKRLLKYQSLLWVLLMVASGGNILHAQDMEEKAIGEANYSFDTETNKSRIETDGVNKKDVKKAHKQARKEEREKRRQAKWARYGNSGHYYSYYPYSYYPYSYYPYSYRYGHHYRYRHYHGGHHY